MKNILIIPNTTDITLSNQPELKVSLLDTVFAEVSSSNVILTFCLSSSYTSQLKYL